MIAVVGCCFLLMLLFLCHFQFLLLLLMMSMLRMLLLDVVLVFVSVFKFCCWCCFGFIVSETALVMGGINAANRI